ncbi:hypothetical protein KV337_003558 [Escherichia coli]|nr:hypothetical protein [Escherichia coli]EHS3292724.1 hypothetical protein [Escherichia coli]EHS3308042.1 hypothetical protein [Escherichia coli]EHS3323304.1 hypothetical protein [Escherichia coli]EHS3328423.1 hypothetical protein [Escherichia coli]
MKIVNTLAVAIATCLVASTPALAAKDASKGTATATATFNVLQDCQLTLVLNEDSTPKELNSLATGVVVALPSVTPSCDGQVYLESGEKDGTGYGVMTTPEGVKANFSINVGSANGTVWVWDSTNQLAYTETSVSAGTSVHDKIQLVDIGEYGLPKQPGNYSYTIHAGYWIN